MGLFDQFPYTNFHELNLDWLLKMMKELDNTVENFVALNTIKYADPIQWNITTQYEKNTIVIEPNSGTAYISVQPVPVGVSIGNTDYWTVVFSLDAIIDSINNNLTNHIDNNVTTATFNSSIGDWLIWNNDLYLVTSAINAGDAYTVGGNIERKSVEELVASYITVINTTLASIINDIGDLTNLTTSDKSNLVAAIDEIKSSLDAAILDYDGKIGTLSNLNTTDKSNTVAAINEVLGNLAQEIQDRIDADTLLSNRIDNIDGGIFVSVTNYGATGDGVTDDTAAIQQCINENDNVYFPAGTYICKMVKLNSNNYLLGSNATLKLPTGLTSGDVIGELETNYDFQMSATLWGDSIENVTINNLILDGNVLTRDSDDLKLADGIFIFNSDNIRIENVHITESLSHGFELYRCSNSIINKCVAEKSGQAKKEYLTGSGGDTFILHANCSKCTIMNCKSYYSWDVGFELEGRGGDTLSVESIKYCSITNCICDYSRDHAYLILNSIGCEVTNCIANHTHYLSTGINDGAAFIILGGNSNILSNLVSKNATKYFVSITNEGNSNLNPTNMIVNNIIGDIGGGICIKNAYNSLINNARLNTTKAMYSNADVHIEYSEYTEVSNIYTRAARNYAIYAISSTNIFMHDIFSRSTVYGAYLSAISGVIDNLTQYQGTRGVAITGSSTAYLILNNINEIQTSDDITTSYGGFSFVHINSNTHVA